MRARVPADRSTRERRHMHFASRDDHVADTRTITRASTSSNDEDRPARAGFRSNGLRANACRRARKKKHYSEAVNSTVVRYRSIETRRRGGIRAAVHSPIRSVARSSIAFWTTRWVHACIHPWVTHMYACAHPIYLHVRLSCLMYHLGPKNSIL